MAPDSAGPPRPVGVRAPHGAKVFEISWQTGQTHALPHRVLRGFCPCAGCQGHSGTLRFVEPTGSLALELRDIEQVGQYALGLKWADGHTTGIYSFEYLFLLGSLLESRGAEALEAAGELPRARA